MAPKKVIKTAKVWGRNAVHWEFKADKAGWTRFVKEDSMMLEVAYKTKGRASKFKTTDFTFNKEYGSVYTIDFSKMTQKNEDSKTIREIRRVDPAQ
eukprot:CAMPEP_0113821770 /NCGR_PEP_ID=MMETSP0328-20130328/1906_1 /TAXON_ID=39455 /ORGANISM="Alexandrium minutum" /LENGTH=95 /DNA_ID=CAMNT_0000789705 /DNA_START=68 /DNA_END=355 /DNA_ORIENTATION=- /assembly_acc=CAM_ASM_000350